MTIYEKNCESLKKYKEDLFDKLMNYKEDALEHARINYGIDKVESISTKEDNKALVIYKQAEMVRLNSAYKPSAEAAKWAEQFEIKNIECIISMFGLGNGVFAREVLKNTTQENFLLLYEPCPVIFLHVLNNYDLTDILENNRVSITVEGINDTEYKSILGYVVNWVNMKSQIVCKHPQYKALFEEGHNRFLNYIRDNNEICTINKNTEKVLSKSIIRNTLSNLKYIKEANVVTDFYKAFGEEIPAIIVSAGPSLDKNVRELEKAKGKAVIFCTDTALKSMLKYDILPDFVVTLDPNKSKRHFVDERSNQIPILCLIEANTTNLEKHKNRKIFYNLNDFITQLYVQGGKKIVNINSGGSVATGAFSACISMGFKNIILIGQDLAYAGKYTHAEGRADHGGKLANDARLVEDIYGNQIYTRGDWYLYLQWFEQTIEARKELEVVDATEGGAKIHGTKIMTFLEAIDLYCTHDIDCDSIICDMKPTFSESEMPFIKKYLKNSMLELVSIKGKARENKKLCEKLIIEAKKKNIDSEKCQNWVKKLSKNNELIEEKPVYSLVDIHIAEASTTQLDDIYVLSQDEVQAQIITYEKATVIYEAMTEACDNLEGLIEKELDEL